MKILQIILGVILLLPGICSAGVMLIFLPDLTSGDMATLLPLWIGAFGVAALGIWLIRNARNRP